MNRRSPDIFLSIVLLTASLKMAGATVGADIDSVLVSPLTGL